jgi:hypothetical protein
MEAIWPGESQLDDLRQASSFVDDRTTPGISPSGTRKSVNLGRHSLDLDGALTRPGRVDKKVGPGLAEKKMTAESVIEDPPNPHPPNQHPPTSSISACSKSDQASSRSSILQIKHPPEQVSSKSTSSKLDILQITHPPATPTSPSLRHPNPYSPSGLFQTHLQASISWDFASVARQRR